MRIEWTAEAATELDRMLAFVASKSVVAAALIAERVLRTERSILQFPFAGRHDAATDTYDRYVLKTRVILTYAIRDEVIWVITAWHTSRDPLTRPPRRGP